MRERNGQEETVEEDYSAKKVSNWRIAVRLERKGYGAGNSDGHENRADLQSQDGSSSSSLLPLLQEQAVSLGLIINHTTPCCLVITEPPTIRHVLAAEHHSCQVPQIPIQPWCPRPQDPNLRSRS